MDKRTSVISIALVGLMFFIFGFVSWVNAILIPYFKISLELTNFQSYLVAFAFYIAYLVMSVPASLLLEKLGYEVEIPKHTFSGRTYFSKGLVRKARKLAEKNVN